MQQQKTVQKQSKSEEQVIEVSKSSDRDEKLNKIDEILEKVDEVLEDAEDVLFKEKLKTWAENQNRLDCDTCPCGFPVGACVSFRL